MCRDDAEAEPPNVHNQIPRQGLSSGPSLCILVKENVHFTDKFVNVLQVLADMCAFKRQPFNGIQFVGIIFSGGPRDLATECSSPKLGVVYGASCRAY